MNETASIVEIEIENPCPVPGCRREAEVARTVCATHEQLLRPLTRKALGCSWRRWQKAFVEADQNLHHARVRAMGRDYQAMRSEAIGEICQTLAVIMVDGRAYVRQREAG